MPDSAGGLPNDLAGRTAVVTAAAHGIGLAIARRLLAAGSTVIAVDRDEAALSGAFSRNECVRVVGDLGSDDVPSLADRLVREHGPITLIVNGVGVTTPHDFLGLGPAEFDLVFRTNIRGPWFFTRQLVRPLVESGTGGSVLFITSVHDTFVRLHPHYSASKAAVAMLVKELALELAPRGIRVNAVAPGWIQTGERVERDHEEAFSRRIPAGHPGDPDDVARMAVILLSDEWSGYVTGANVRVDGGLSLHTWMTDLPR